MYCLDDSPWAATPGQRELVANLLLDHTRWFVEGGRLNIVILGRTYERKARPDRIVEALWLMSHVDTPRRAELEATAVQFAREVGSLALGAASIAAKVIGRVAGPVQRISLLARG